ncbi:hypothetical protein [Mycobacterium sp. ACS4331]|uniref:hypothetical protein n=1 Tax=Mycobacterium sp. ACS4331 TaxID=1834121 RepID=UPI0007FF57FE|nr:hypothetical protein [Mycobacterium sp. ACS4331]OBF25680.1 hypothetical protein A5727_03925 [Mycobacterium sp. ACS4331]
MIRARVAFGALLLAGATLAVGPVGTAVAAPTVDIVASPSSSGEDANSVDSSPGQLRAVLVSPRLRPQRLSDDDTVRLQQVLDRHNKALSTVSNILKKQSASLSRILGNMK